MRLSGPLFTLALSALGCGGLGTAPRPEAAECLDGMEEIVRLERYSSPHQLVWHDGVLYLNGGAPPELKLYGTHAISDRGGPLTDFTGGHHWMKADGENLLMASADRFFSVPFAGGPEQLVADGGTGWVGDEYYGNVYAQAADDDFFYWMQDRWTEEGPVVWAKPRSGGPSVSMGIPEPAEEFGLGSQVSLTPVGRELIVASPRGYAWAIDKTTLAWRALASSPSAFQHHTFVDESGVLWSSYLGGSGEYEAFGMSQSPLGGEPLRPFWRSKPSRMVASSMFSDGAGGWIVGALEWFTDDKIHTSVWTLDANQQGQRRACLPALGSAGVAAVAFSPEYVFLAVFAWPDGGDFYTSIYRLPRRG